MAVLYNWVPAGGGDFNTAANWHHNGNMTGVPGSSDPTSFSVGGTYTVSGGGTVASITTGDNLTLQGSYTAALGIGGSTNTLTLAGGTFTTDPTQGGSVHGEKLTISGATVHGGGVSDFSALTITGSSFDLTGGVLGSLVGNGLVSIASSTAHVSTFGVAGEGALANDTITVYGAGAGTGTASVFGTFTVTGTSFASLSTDLVGTINWTGGKIDTGDFTSGKGAGGVGSLSFDGTTLSTVSVADENNSADPTDISLKKNTHWTNADDFSSSGSLAMTGGSTLITSSFSVDPNQGSGAAVSLDGKHTELSDADTFGAFTLKIMNAAEVFAGNAVTLHGSGNLVSGNDSTLSGGRLSLTGTFGQTTLAITKDAFVHTDGASLTNSHILVDHASWRVDDSVSFTGGLSANEIVVRNFGVLDLEEGFGAGGTITIASNGLMILFGDALGSIVFAKGQNEAISIGFPDFFVDAISGFGAGDAIVMDSIGKKTTFSVSQASGETILIFHSGGKTVGTLQFEGSYKKGDFHFNAADGSLTSSAPIVGTKKPDDLVGTAGDDTLSGKGGADKLIGYAGADDLHGGKDHAKDVFVFKSDDDSGKTKKTADHVFDFKSGVDKIDLSDLDVKWKDIDLHDKGPNVKVLVDTHGSHKPDMLIQVMHIAHLHQGDFIL